MSKKEKEKHEIYVYLPKTTTAEYAVHIKTWDYGYTVSHDGEMVTPGISVRHKDEPWAKERIEEEERRVDFLGGDGVWKKNKALHPPLPRRQHLQAMTQEKLKSLLDYNPETGVFTWKRRTDIENLRIRNGWNSKYAGRQAGSKVKTPHLPYIRIAGYLAHRLAWLYMTGEWPEEGKEIDHINGDASDNRFCNLKACDPFSELAECPLSER